MTTVSETPKTNWLGLATIVGLLIWFLVWFKKEPETFAGHVLLWGPFVVVHVLAILAAAVVWMDLSDPIGHFLDTGCDYPHTKRQSQLVQPSGNLNRFSTTLQVD